jgi:hypothetical protein
MTSSSASAIVKTCRTCITIQRVHMNTESGEFFSGAGMPPSCMIDASATIEQSEPTVDSMCRPDWKMLMSREVL